MAIDKRPLNIALLEDTAMALATALLPAARISPDGTVYSNFISVGAGSTAQFNVQWPCDGVLVGIRATTEDGLQASMSGTLLRVQVNGNTELFPSGSGQGAGFAPFAAISGSASFMGQYSARRAFKQVTQWVISIQNTGITTVVADVGWDYINTSSPPQA